MRSNWPYLLIEVGNVKGSFNENKINKLLVLLCGKIK